MFPANIPYNRKHYPCQLSIFLYYGSRKVQRKSPEDEGVTFSTKCRPPKMEYDGDLDDSESMPTRGVRKYFC